MSSQLPGIFHSLEPILDRYGYAAVVVLVGVEGFGIPLPGQTVLIVAGVWAGAGQLSLLAVLALGALAAVGGDNIGYAVGRFGGRELILRFGRYVFFTEQRLVATERFFDRRGQLVVPMARFVEGMRQANGIVAGLGGMRWWRFLTYNAIGGITWVLLWVLTGYLAGNHIDGLYRRFEHYQFYVYAVVAAVVIGLIMRWAARRRSRDAA